MKNILAWLVLLLFFLSAKAQTLTGKVYRFGTDSILAGASVYYGGSMKGTATDKNGHFQLQSQAKQIPVIVSCIGYYSATVNYVPGQALTIYLKPKTEELHTVTIKADGMYRNQEEQQFISEFIGTSDYSKSCSITNIADINLFFDASTQTLNASCDKPIIIENKRLGYTITYYLDNFASNPDRLTFNGNYTFKDNIATGNASKIKRDREKVYEGSRMEFIRALWHNTLQKAGFSIFKYFIPLHENDIVVTDSLQQKYIHWQGQISIRHYMSNAFVTSLEKNSFINKDGFYSNGLQWGGPLAHQRIGDLLPFEYRSEKESADIDTTAPVVTTENINQPVPAKRSAPPLSFEKTYLHTDRDVYAQGDTLWFKAYLVNAQDHQPINSSGTLYVELLAPDSAKIINREITRLDNGLGNGDMELTDSLPSGKYRLRAYTNWMRNFGDAFAFEKNITILNTQAVPLPSDLKAAVAKNKGKDIKTVTAALSTATAALTTVATINLLPVVRFYPEGGSLVEGISSMVAAKAEDGYGSGIPVYGAVLSSAGDTVARFSCDSLGMGLFALLPVKGQSYHAVVNPIAGSMPFRRDIVFELPSALSKGLTLQIRQTDSVIHAIVNSPDVSGEGLAVAADHPVTVSLLVKHSGKTLLSQQLTLQGTQAAFKLETTGLPEGISAITLYDAQGKPHCERLVYIHHPNHVVKTNISTDKKIYQPKEKVNINISAPANSNLSMAVVDAGIVPEQADNIVSYLQLQSEVKGSIESARRYFDTTNVNRFKQLDLLLMTQGWRDFVWRRLADTAIRISYAAEGGISVPGRVWEEVRNKYLPNLNVSLHADGAVANKQFATATDSAGRFHFDGLILYGQQNVRLNSINDKGEDKGTILLDTLLPLKVNSRLVRPAAWLNPVDSAATLAVEKKVESLKNVKIAGITKLKEINIKASKSIYTRSGNLLTPYAPDQIFNITPKDYEYKTLQWYILQNVKGAMASSREFHGNVPTGVEFSGLDTALKTPPPWKAYISKLVLMPPQIFVNGQELYMDENTQAEAYRTLYFNMPMNKFKSIVVKHMAGTLHGRDADGKPLDSVEPIDRWLLYLTMQDNYTNDNPGWLSANIPGYYKARSFYEPQPNAKPSIADYRTTIHWEPNIKTDATGKATISFYTAVPQTDVRVVVQGITDAGIPVVATTGYVVK